jgi:dUTPase
MFIIDKIKFLKTREVKDPSRANTYDAGIDFYVPEFTSEFIALLKEKNPDIIITEEFIILDTNERVLIPSGIHCQMFEPGRALVAANKSGVATKHGLIFGAQVVDFEYQGEIHLSVINTSNCIVKIIPGTKILQFLEIPVYNSIIDITIEKTPKEFYEKETTRGPAGFGSTDNKV